jgi:hypothetical protein
MIADGHARAATSVAGSIELARVLEMAVVGVAGVLAFSVSTRTREFGIGLATGSQSSRLLAGVMRDAAVMATAGIIAGVARGYVLAIRGGDSCLGPPGRVSADGALAVREIGALSDFDDITVRIADVTANLAVLGNRLGNELSASAFP